MKQIETSIQIQSTPETIWNILTDFDRHPAWNPFIKSISGGRKPGEKLRVVIQPPGSKGMTFTPTVLVFSAPMEFRWIGSFGIRGLFDGEHYFIIRKIDDTTSEFIHGETFKGILVFLLGGMLDATRRGFELMNQALKERSEAMHAKERGLGL